MDDTLMIFFLIAAIVWIQVLTPPKLGLPPQKQSVSDREPFIHTKATEALSGGVKASPEISFTSRRFHYFLESSKGTVRARESISS